MGYWMLWPGAHYLVKVKWKVLKNFTLQTSMNLLSGGYPVHLEKLALSDHDT